MRAINQSSWFGTDLVTMDNRANFEAIIMVIVLQVLFKLTLALDLASRLRSNRQNQNTMVADNPARNRHPLFCHTRGGSRSSAGLWFCTMNRSLAWAILLRAPFRWVAFPFPCSSYLSSLKVALETVKLLPGFLHSLLEYPCRRF